MTAAPDPTTPADAPVQSPTASAALFFLAVLPVAHLVSLPVGGAIATGADVALLGLLMAGAVDLMVQPHLAARLARVLTGERVPGLPDRRVYVGIACLLAYAAWVGLSGVWGFHQRYAAAKGVGLGALALGAGALVSSGVGWRRAADAWLVGTAAALIVTVLLAGFGPDALRFRVFSGGTGILGLPFARLSGPLVHPNMFGDYLVVSGVLLWARWPELPVRWAALALAAGLATALVFTVSTAWVGGGVVLVLLGHRMATGGRRGAGAALRIAGLGIAAAVLVSLVVPLDFRVGWMRVVTNAIRPAIWRSSLDAVVTNPLVGVGAAPYLAQAADPLRGGAMGLWDAHDAYLSVLGQFGVVGFTLAATGVGCLVAAIGRAAAPERARTAMTLAVLAVGVHAIFLASEDLRHVWMVLALAGVLAVDRG